MRALGLSVVALCIVLLSSQPASSQAAKNKDLIVGKWDIGMETTIEYKKDGTLVMKVRDITVNGKYSFVDNDTIEVTITVGEKTKKNKLKVEIKDDEMTTTDPEGKSNRLKRVK